MTSNELKKLSRSELIEILLEQENEMDSIKIKLVEANRALEDKKLNFSKAGNLAEASIMVSGVLEAAQAAADMYLENIRESEGVCDKMREDAEAQTKQKLADAEAQAQKIVGDAEAQAQKIVGDADAQAKQKLADADAYAEKTVGEADALAKKTIADAEAKAIVTVDEAEKAAEAARLAAKAETERYWKEVSERLESFYNEHNGLKDLLKIGGGL